MADPRGPKLALGDTEPRKDVADSVEKAEKLAQTKQDSAKVQQAQEILAQKYDESLCGELKVEEEGTATQRSICSGPAAGLCAPRSRAERSDCGHRPHAWTGSFRLCVGACAREGCERAEKGGEASQGGSKSGVRLKESGWEPTQAD